MQSTGHTSTHDLSSVSIHGWVMTYVTLSSILTRGCVEVGRYSQTLVGRQPETPATIYGRIASLTNERRLSSFGAVHDIQHRAVEVFDRSRSMDEEYFPLLKFRGLRPSSRRLAPTD